MAPKTGYFKWIAQKVILDNANDRQTDVFVLNMITVLLKNQTP